MSWPQVVDDLIQAIFFLGAGVLAVAGFGLWLRSQDKGKDK